MAPPRDMEEAMVACTISTLVGHVYHRTVRYDQKSNRREPGENEYKCRGLGKTAIGDVCCVCVSRPILLDLVAAHTGHCASTACRYCSHYLFLFCKRSSIMGLTSLRLFSGDLSFILCGVAGMPPNEFIRPNDQTTVWGTKFLKSNQRTAKAYPRYDKQHYEISQLFPIRNTMSN